MEAWGIVLIIVAIVVLAILLFLFCTKTRTGRSLLAALCYSNSSQPLITEGTQYGQQRCRILDDRWRNELLQFKRISLKSVGDCAAICVEIRRQLRKVSFVEDVGDMTVVVTLKTTRVQSDAESALEQIGHYSENRHRVILLMFHKVVGSKTLEDVEAVMYQNPDVKKTFHVPYQ